MVTSNGSAVALLFVFCMTDTIFNYYKVLLYSLMFDFANYWVMSLGSIELLGLQVVLRMYRLLA